MSPSNRPGPRTRAVLSPELLEDRTVPSGNVTAFVSGGVLHISGDSQANRIWVMGLGNGQAIVAPLDDTTINGGHAPAVFGAIAFAYNAQLGGGDDYLWVTNTRGGAALFVDTGAGNDTVAMHHTRHDGITFVNTGAGNDTVAFGMTELSNASHFALGAGDDRIQVGGAEFNYVVFDGAGGSDTMSLLGADFNVAPILLGSFAVLSGLSGQPPVANGDTARVRPGESVTVNVAANDAAPGGALNRASIQITDRPDRGTVRVNGDGTVTYTSDGSSTRPDRFRYTIRNAAGVVSNEATVLVLAPVGTVPTVIVPEPTITSNATGGVSSAATIQFTVTFDENVTGFDATDVSVTNGTRTNFTAVNPRTFRFDVTPTADGAVTVSVPAGAAVDADGNPSTAGSLTVTSDRAAPTVSITSSASNPTGLASIPFTVTFSEPVTGFAQQDIGVSNGTVTGFSGSGTTYTFSVTPTVNGPVTVTVGAGVALDAGQNGNSAATPFTITSERNAPAVTLSTTATGPTDLSPIPFTAQFSEAVTGFAAGDVTVTNGTVSNFVAVDADTYTFDVTPTADGTVTVNVAAGVAQDTAANGNTAATPVSLTSDRTPPTPTVSSTVSGSTGTSPIPFTVTFTEAVTGFTAGDVLVTNGAVTGFSGSGTTYTFNVVPAAAGAVTVSVPANVSEDAATNGNAASNVYTVTYSGTIVSATIARGAGVTDPTNLATIPVTVTFSESVTGFDASDLIIINGAASNFAGSGTTYTFDLTPTADGPVLVNIAAGAAAGASGPSSAANFQITSDRTNPAVAVNATADDAITGTSSDANDVTGVQVSISNGTNFWGGTAFDSASEVFFAATSSDGFATWSLTFAPGGPFTVHARATDEAGNQGNATNNNVTVT